MGAAITTFIDVRTRLLMVPPYKSIGKLRAYCAHRWNKGYSEKTAYRVRGKLCNREGKHIL